MWAQSKECFKVYDEPSNDGINECFSGLQHGRQRVSKDYSTTAFYNHNGLLTRSRRVSIGLLTAMLVTCGASTSMCMSTALALNYCWPLATACPASTQSRNVNLEESSRPSPKHIETSHSRHGAMLATHDLPCSNLIGRHLPLCCRVWQSLICISDDAVILRLALWGLGTFFTCDWRMDEWSSPTTKLEMVLSRGGKLQRSGPTFLGNN